MINRLEDIQIVSSQIHRTSSCNHLSVHIDNNNVTRTIRLASSASDLLFSPGSGTQRLSRNNPFGRYDCDFDRQYFHKESGNNMMISSDSIVSIGDMNLLFTPIDTSLSKIMNATNQINNLLDIKRTGMPNQQRDAIKQVENLRVEVTDHIRTVQKSLKIAKKDNQHNTAADTKDHLFENLFNSRTRQFEKLIIQFQQATLKFKDTVCDDFTRQARIVNPQITDQQILQMIQTSSNPSQYLEAVSNEMIDQISELEEEHARLQKLEKTVMEIQDLFNACATLVDQTQSHLDNIEANVNTTKIETRKGKEKLKQAAVYVKRTRTV